MENFEYIVIFVIENSYTETTYVSMLRELTKNDCFFH